MEQISETQAKLFKPFGQTCFPPRIDQAKRNQLPLGKTLPELDGRNQWEKILGPFAVKVGLVTDPENPKTLVPEQLAAFGGWCAIRTADVENLEKGIIANPKTGLTESIQSASQVARFIEDGVTFDQIVESIGAVNCGSTIAVSEETLWGNRVIEKVKSSSGVRLNAEGEDQIRQAIAEAEQQRFVMTGRYLKMARGFNNLQRVRDTDIFPILKETRDKLLSDLGIRNPAFLATIGSGKQMPPISVVDGQTLIFTMYTEGYCKALKEAGLTSADKFLIAEPLLHTYASSEALNYLVFRVFGERGNGIYFDLKGTNPNTGFGAFVECLTPSATSVRRVMNMGAVPNVSNWEIMCSQEKDSSPLSGILTPERNRELDPARNRLFLWALNFIPFGDTLETLLAVVDTAERFKNEKKQVKGVSTSENKFQVSESAQRRVQNLREQCLNDLDLLNQKLACDLEGFFRYLTEGIKL